MMGRAAEKAAGQAWTSRGWQKAGTAEVPSQATLTYVNAHGASRMLLSGTRVLRVDGAPPEVLEKLWPTVLETRFVSHARDTWQPGDDDLALRNAGFVDEERGVGLTAPHPGWEITKGGQNPRALATARNEEHKVQAQLVVVGQEVPVQQLVPLLKGELLKTFPQFTGEVLGELPVGDHDGVRLALGASTQGVLGELILATGAGRTFVLTVNAATQTALDATREDVKALAASLVTRE
jgi:hypothetical protein